MNITITTEKPEDYLAIYELVKISFQSAPNADGDEHEYVSKLRSSANYIPQLAFVLKTGQEIIGHIMLTTTRVNTFSENFEALLLSPVCIHPQYQNLGLGAKLINYVLNQAKLLNHKAVLLVGEPEYYKRFGFKAIKNFGLKNIGDIPEQYTLGLELEMGYLAIENGMVNIV